MSNSDSFIEEVTEEVRRDRLYALMRRYGWIAVLAILLLVGGAAWNEWRKAQAQARAEAFGDALVAALALPEAEARAAALDTVTAPGPGGSALRDLLAAATRAETDPQGAATRLLAVADNAEVPQVYRQIATLKAVALPDSGLGVEDRRARLAPLAAGTGLLRLLAEEQLALIDIETGARDAAIARLAALAVDAEATAALRRRATQVIVALGEVPPEMPGLAGDLPAGR
ncbi:MAG: hypothetical protein H5U16_05695 [Roseovarius sp.]|nr:hypothetical protein [Roseovarius sp.]